MIKSVKKARDKLEEQLTRFLVALFGVELFPRIAAAWSRTTWWFQRQTQPAEPDIR